MLVDIKFDNLICLTCDVFFPLLFIFKSFLTSIFVTKIPLHANVWNFLSMRIRFGLLFHVIKHMHTDYQCSICYFLVWRTLIKKTLARITVGVQAMWPKNSTSVMSEIHKIENKKVHIKWLVSAKYYTKIYRSPGVSVLICISINGWSDSWCPSVTHLSIYLSSVCQNNLLTQYYIMIIIMSGFITIVDILTRNRIMCITETPFCSKWCLCYAHKLKTLYLHIL